MNGTKLKPNSVEIPRFTLTRKLLRDFEQEQNDGPPGIFATGTEACSISACCGVTLCTDTLCTGAGCASEKACC